jgi:hypothetical protein
MDATSGYSGTPLARKLGITAGTTLVARHAPREYASWLAPCPAEVRFEQDLSGATQIAHIFVHERSVLVQELQEARRTMPPTAAVWVSWPKKSSKVITDITEDTIREVALPLGFVDVKVCAVSPVWSGLKLVVRKELR